MAQTSTVSKNVVTVRFDGAPSASGVTMAAPIGRPAPPLLETHYHVVTAGKSADDIMAEIGALAGYHAEKSARVFDAATLIGTPLVIGAETYTWRCIFVRERGTDCEMYASVVDATGQFPTGVPVTIVRHTIAELPNNNELAAIVAAAITTESSREAAEAQKMTDLQALLGV